MQLLGISPGRGKSSVKSERGWREDGKPHRNIVTFIKSPFKRQDFEHIVTKIFKCNKIQWKETQNYMTMTLTILTLACKGHQPFIFSVFWKYTMFWLTGIWHLSFTRKNLNWKPRHLLKITQYLQRAVPVLMDFQLNCQTEREMSCFFCLIWWTGIWERQKSCSRLHKSAARAKYIKWSLNSERT